MLRACNRVLRPGRKLVFYVIHLLPGITPARKAALIEELPGLVDTPAPYPQLVEQAGFTNIAERDVTPAYQRTAVLRQEAGVELEPGLRAALGDKVYEERRANRQASAAAIEAGELGRTLFSATAS